ncbi:MAG: hypothetical protein WC279_09740 [Sulfurimonas sp.]|jgi:hypothetical protein|uniref:hypothetical protein n=1 Tax=Sulfurimonas sp. TaxID=2022749 RepID=UPI00356788DC
MNNETENDQKIAGSKKEKKIKKNTKMLKKDLENIENYDCCFIENDEKIDVPTLVKYDIKVEKK